MFPKLVEVAEFSPSGANLIRVPVIELAWRLDSFQLRVYRMRLSSVAHELAEQFAEYVRNQRRQDDFRYYEWMGLSPGICKPPTPLQGERFSCA
ncbi:Uncharacterized protein HZ326_24617 [Fusarium oxysporum f. sp. albedinis]|nr:Uncharacterized protein HZ326_24617 [Fusarium oxysporum f. sp. albedinis]